MQTILWSSLFNCGVFFNMDPSFILFHNFVLYSNLFKNGKQQRQHCYYIFKNLEYYFLFCYNSLAFKCLAIQSHQEENWIFVINRIFGDSSGWDLASYNSNTLLYLLSSLTALNLPIFNSFQLSHVGIAIYKDWDFYDNYSLGSVMQYYFYNSQEWKARYYYVVHKEIKW